MFCLRAGLNVEEKGFNVLRSAICFTTRSVLWTTRNVHLGAIILSQPIAKTGQKALLAVVEPMKNRTYIDSAARMICCRRRRFWQFFFHDHAKYEHDYLIIIAFFASYHRTVHVNQALPAFSSAMTEHSTFFPQHFPLGLHWILILTIPDIEFVPICRQYKTSRDIRWLRISFFSFRFMLQPRLQVDHFFPWKLFNLRWNLCGCWF